MTLAQILWQKNIAQLVNKKRHLNAFPHASSSVFSQQHSLSCPLFFFFSFSYFLTPDHCSYLKEKVGEEEAEKAQNGHNLDRDALGTLLNGLRELSSGLLLALTALDVALAETAVLVVGEFGVRRGQLGLEVVDRVLARAAGEDRTGGKGRGCFYGLFLGVVSRGFVVVRGRSAGAWRRKVSRQIGGIRAL